MKKYLEESGRTAATLDEVRTDVYKTHAHFLYDLNMFIEAGCNADLLKRSLFYKEDIEKTKARGLGFQIKNRKLYDDINVIQLTEEDKPVEEQLRLSDQKIDIIHACLGMISEAGEILEEVLKATVEKRELDIVNLKEEAGDQLWYNALFLRSIGSDFETEAKNNIAKLSKRYPDKFSSENALERNLEEERELLEKQSA